MASETIGVGPISGGGNRPAEADIATAGADVCVLSSASLDFDGTRYLVAMRGQVRHTLTSYAESRSVVTMRSLSSPTA